MQVIEASTWGLPAPPWFPGRRDTTRQPPDVPIVMWHQTAVSGGFGVSDRAVERNGGREPALLERFTGSEHLAAQSSDGKAGEPYHYVYRPQERRVLAVWHPSRYTHHGNYNARTIGIALDGRYPGDDLDEVQLRLAFVAVIGHLRAAGWWPSVIEYHRQHSSARGGDPGEAVAVVVETVAIPFGITADPEHTTNGGQTVPDSWRSPLAGGGSSSCDGHPTLDIPSMPSGVFDADVQTLQAQLHARGYGPGGLLGSNGRPDGKPGPGTARELRAFQADRRLAVDAIAGPATWTELFARPGS